MYLLCVFRSHFLIWWTLALPVKGLEESDVGVGLDSASHCENTSASSKLLCRICLTNDNRRARKKHSWGCHLQAGMEALRVENSSFGWAYLTRELLGENHPVFPLHLYEVKLHLDQLWLNFLLRIFFSTLFFTFFVKAECTCPLNMLTKDISICYGNRVSSFR